MICNREHLVSILQHTTKKGFKERITVKVLGIINLHLILDLKHMVSNWHKLITGATVKLVV